MTETGNSISVGIMGEQTHVGFNAPRQQSLLSPFNSSSDLSDPPTPGSSHRVALEEMGKFILNTPLNDQAVDNLALAMWRRAEEWRYRRLSEGYFELLICSSGGSCDVGHFMGHIINRVRSEFNIKTKTIAVGSVSSMAAVLLQYGDWRCADRLAQIMIHDTYLTYSGAHTLGRPNLAERSTQLDITAQYMSELFAMRNTKGYDEPEWWNEKMLTPGRDVWLTSSQAFDLGLIDEIIGGYASSGSTPL